MKASVSQVNPKILIVDDNLQIRMLLRLQLRKFDVPSDEADHGESALERVRANFYDLILLDIAMPVMDGFTCQTKIREYQRNGKRSSIIAVSGQSSAEECKRRGFDGFLSKPVLLADIQKLLNEQELKVLSSV